MEKYKLAVIFSFSVFSSNNIGLCLCQGRSEGVASGAPAPNVFSKALKLFTSGAFVLGSCPTLKNFQ